MRAAVQLAEYEKQIYRRIGFPLETPNDTSRVSTETIEFVYNSFLRKVGDLDLPYHDVPHAGTKAVEKSIASNILNNFRINDPNLPPTPLQLPHNMADLRHLIMIMGEQACDVARGEKQLRQVKPDINKYCFNLYNEALEREGLPALPPRQATRGG